MKAGYNPTTQNKYNITVIDLFKRYNWLDKERLFERHNN